MLAKGRSRYALLQVEHPNGLVQPAAHRVSVVEEGAVEARPLQSMWVGGWLRDGSVGARLNMAKRRLARSHVHEI